MKINDIQIGQDYAVTSASYSKADWDDSLVQATALRIEDQVVRRGYGTVPAKTERRIVMQRVSDGRELTLRGIGVLCPWDQFAEVDAERRARQNVEISAMKAADARLVELGVGSGRQVSVKHRRRDWRDESQGHELEMTIRLTGTAVDQFLGRL